MIESVVRLTKEGVRALLSQAGLITVWWTYAMAAFWFGRNNNPSQDGTTAFSRRHLGLTNDPCLVPFGALVEYKPNRTAAQAADRWGPVLRYGIFVGWHCDTGVVWSGDYLIADCEIFQNNPNASPHDVKPTRTSEIIYSASNFEFPLQVFQRKRT